MFAIMRDVSAAKRVIATLLAIALVTWSFAHFTFAEAANLTNISNTLTDSAPSAQSGHEIAFTIPAGSSLTTGDTIEITFPAAFTTVDSSVSGDLTVTVEGGAETIGTFDSSGQVINIDGIAAAAEEEVKIVIAENVITNPSSTGSYELEVSTGTDTGKTRVVVTDTVELTASVDTVFDFTVVGKATTTSVNGTTTTRQSNSTAIPFGTLDHFSVETLAQDLLVSTNAANGFVVTVESDGDFQSSTGAVIDIFADGTLSATPAAWAAPSNDVNDRTTWGHWAVTSEDQDTDGNRGGDEFTSDTWVGVSTTPIALFAHDGPADGNTAGIGSTTVGYQVEISPLQEAGDDYSTVLTYIATPTF